MKQVKVFGIGNRIMGDDGIGVLITEALLKEQASLMVLQDQPEYIVGETDVDYCLDKIDGEDNIVLIDAVLSGREAGTITLFSADEFLDEGYGPISLHECHLVKEIQRVYAMTPTVIGIEIDPRHIQYCRGLSPTLNAHSDKIIGQVKALLISHFT